MLLLLRYWSSLRIHTFILTFHKNLQIGGPLDEAYVHRFPPLPPQSLVIYSSAPFTQLELVTFSSDSFLCRFSHLNSHYPLDEP